MSSVLVSNAGETVRAPLESVPLAMVEHLFQLNTLGALHPQHSRPAPAALPPRIRRRACSP
jgi:NAD(P)-dependent dehydrogenase (short-subunit alcohol dehydrogenase family)